MYRKPRTLVLIFLALISFAVLAAACTSEAGGDARKSSVNLRNEVFTAAEAKYPPYRPVNFPAREALNEYTRRQDRPNHPYYVYLLGENGNVVSYFVSKTLPVSVCAFLSSTEDVRDDTDGNLIMTAPSLDGIFYGGAGASAACNGWFIFDQVTDAMITVNGIAYFIADAPLKLDLKPIEVLIVKE